MAAPRSPRHDASWTSQNSADSGTYSGTIDSVFGAAPRNGPQGYFPYPTIIVVHTTGSVHEVPGIGYYYNINYGPTGNANGSHTGTVGVALTSDLGGTNRWPAYRADSGQTTDTIRVDAGVSISGFRAEAYIGDPGDASHCGPSGYALCRTFVGTAGMSFQRLPAELKLASSIHGRVPMDSAITFGISADPATIAGIAVDISNIHWKWKPAVGSDTTACTPPTALTCTFRVRTSGDIDVTAFVNGALKKQTAHVEGGIITCSQVPEVLANHPELANPVMDSILRQLWDSARYSPDTLDRTRREVGGWITYNPNTHTYGFVWSNGGGTACRLASDTTPIPQYAIAYVHVHPFRPNDSTYPCGDGDRYRDRKTGRWYRYPGGASGHTGKDPEYDYGALLDYKNEAGREIKGVILDASGIVTYELSDLDLNGYPKKDANGKLKNGIYHERCSY